MKVSATQARYIKLGRQGKWEELCLSDGTLRLGYNEVPHELGIKGDRNSIKKLYEAEGLVASAASNHASQVIDFYQMGSDTIWITFHKGSMYWCTAKPDIEFLGSDKTLFPDGSRLRRTLKGWSNKSVGGRPLQIKNLSGDLTKVAAYRQTICSIKGEVFDYLVRKINDQEIPAISEAKNIQQELTASIEKLVKLLGPGDFELLIDLIFNRSGWQRVSPLGKTQKSIDLDMILPITGQRALVQVKSTSTQKQLEEYLEDFESWGDVRVFYAYHTSKMPLAANKSNITLLGPTEISEQVLNAGLLDWLMQKTG